MSERVERRSRRSAGPGWLATAAGALVLVVVGFALGLVAGAAFEAPGLVADHLAGRTTEVPLAAGGAPTARPAEAPTAEAPAASPAETDTTDATDTAAARRPLGAPHDAAPARPPAPAPAPAAAPPAVAAAPPSAAPASKDGFAIQVGAFGERDAAEALAKDLRGQKLPAYVIAESSGPAPFKVRVGPVDGRGEAERLAARLKTEQRLPTWILSGDAR